MSEILLRKQRKQAMIFSEPEDAIVAVDNMAAIRIDIRQVQREGEDEGENKILHDAPIFANDAKVLFAEQSHESDEEGWQNRRDQELENFGAPKYLAA